RERNRAGYGRRMGMAATSAYWAAAVRYDGLACYQGRSDGSPARHRGHLNPWMSMWALPELVEATGPCGDAGLARDARGAAAAERGRRPPAARQDAPVFASTVSTPGTRAASIPVAASSRLVVSLSPHARGGQSWASEVSRL